ncbi:MAG TPA: formate dehydrogenase accessory sulfurtransferase FdhD, partial [Candidatus Eisenbacteria bacterium]|nr:formate dehydrogenase accessory sulfurtransferase FdhD [Candidatus Eisenbacteria bacterium]
VTGREEHLATEEPLEIRLGDRRLTVTMRTPGADFELAAGLLHAEGVIKSGADLRSIRYCVDPALEDTQRYNVVTVDLADSADAAVAGLERSFLASSACGVCGKQSLEALRTVGARPVEDGLVVPATVLAGLPDRLRGGQRLFERTGGLHAAGLFTAAGDMVAVREDVGRHNAVDKVVGWALLQGRLPLTGMALLVSGRTSYEIVQKAVTAGIPLVASVSAPSSLAVSLAEEYAVTLVGFVRDGRFTVYTGDQRIATG